MPLILRLKGVAGGQVARPWITSSSTSSRAAPLRYCGRRRFAAGVPMAELKFVGTQIQIFELWRRYASQERELGHMVLEGLAVQRPL